MSNKKAKVFSVVLGSAALGAHSAQSNDLISYSEGKVSDTRYELIAKTDMEMRCSRSIIGKIEECKHLMEEASCGKEMKKKKEECKKILNKEKEMSCGECSVKVKDKSKEMSCGTM